MRRLLSVLALAAPLSGAASQSPVVARASNATVTAGEGAVVTAVFALTNVSDDTVAIRAELEVPNGWTKVSSLAPQTLAPRAGDTWIAGVALSASTPAGRYIIRATIHAGSATTLDSMAVVVQERREIEVVPLETPGWTMARGAYDATFLVRNRGNVTATVSLQGRTSRGTRASVTPASVVLAPGAATRVQVRVAMQLSTRTTTDDVIELESRLSGVTDSVIVASSRTTVIPNRRFSSAFESIPVDVAVRSSNGAAGIAPVSVRGSGRIAGTMTFVDFLLQAPTNQDGPVSFGEREEYRLSVASANAAARIGDHLFGWSALTSSGIMGTGVEARASRGPLRAGAYTQRPRWGSGTRGEHGAFTGIALDSTYSASAVFMMRQATDGVTVNVGAFATEARVLGNEIEVEGAISDSAQSRGAAYRARLSRGTERFSYDVSVARGDAAFAGPFGGWRAHAAAASVQVTRKLTLSADGRINEWGGRDTASIASGERLSSMTTSMSWGGAATVEYGWLARRALSQADAMRSVQQGIRLMGTRTVAGVSVTLGAERGQVTDGVTTASRAYAQGTLSLSAAAGRFGSLGLNTVYSHGNTLTGLHDGLADVGVNATLRLPLGFEMGIAGSARRASLGVLDSSGAWFSVMDARVSKRFANGSTIGVHGRTMQSPYTMGSVDGHSRAVYLEYRTGLRLPVARARHAGKLTGRVTNADDGTPLRGALVRLGTEAAITDRDGRVTFAGLEPNVYRVSVETSGGAAGAMIDGDVVLDLREPGTTARTFNVSVTRGANISASVREFTRRGSVGGAATELTDAGALGGVLVRLAGSRDTIHQSTDERGRIEFGNVPPGTYALMVRAEDAPAQSRFERECMEITIRAGESAAVAFRAIPRERTIRVIDAGKITTAR